MTITDRIVAFGAAVCVGLMGGYVFRSLFEYGPDMNPWYMTAVLATPVCALVAFLGWYFIERFAP